MPTTTTLTRVQARAWLDRWDRQQEVYIADREERFAVIGDVVAGRVGRPDPRIVDLGAGPGSLSVRLLDRLPEARVVAVDADPLLLGLARAAYGHRGSLRFVDRDLRTPGWVDALELEGPVDAVVSTTALHWLTPDELDRVYRACADLLRPGGVLVNGDHLGERPDQPRIDELLGLVRIGRAARLDGAAGCDPDRPEGWEQWWAAVAAAPELTELRGSRPGRPVEHRVPVPATLADHVRSLLAAGFSEAGTVWQHGDDRVLVAVR